MSHLKLFIAGLVCILITSCSTSILDSTEVSTSPAATGTTNTSVPLTGQPIVTMTGWIRSGALSNNGNYLAVGTTWGIYIFDTATWSLLWSTPDSHQVSTLEFDPNGNLLAVGAEDGTLQVFDATSGALHSRLIGHTAQVNAVDWSPDGRQLASGSLDYSAIIWNVESERADIVLSTRASEHYGSMETVAWSQDGTILATGDAAGQLIVWNPANGEMEKLILTYTFNTVGPESGIRQIVWSPDASSLLVNGDAFQIGLWKVVTGEPEKENSIKLPPIEYIDWAFAGQPIGIQAQSNQISMYNLLTGDAIYTLPRADNDDTTTQIIVVNLANNLLVTSDQARIVRVWNIETGRQLIALETSSN